MIPDFKTYLKESVWGSIRKKSLGLETRIEDDINNFDLKELCEYTKSRYNLSFDSAVHLSETAKGLCLDAVICEGGKRNILFFVQYNEKKRIIQFSKDIVDLFPYIYQKLLEKYHIVDSYLYSDNNLYAIYRSELKDVDNKLFIEVVDIIVDNFPTDFKKEIYITKKNEEVYESVWGNIRNKSLGMDIRTEDSVDHLNMYDFYEHLVHTYKTVPINGSYHPIEISKGRGVITVPIVFYDKNLYNMYIHEKDRTYVYIIIDIDEIYQECIDDLKSKYDVEIQDQRTVTSNDMCIRIYQKNHKNEHFSNNSCVKLIDFILDMDKPLGNAIEKKVNESVWGDIRKKSLGQEERLENDVNLMDYEELGNYILENYNLADGDGLSWSYTQGNPSGIGIFIIRLDDNNNLLEYFTAVDDDDSKKVTVYPNIEKLDPNLYNKLKETYKLYDTEDRIGMMSLLGIDPKDGRNVDNKFFIEVLNFIIDNLDSKYRKIIDR